MNLHQLKINDVALEVRGANDFLHALSESLLDREEDSPIISPLPRANTFLCL